jgi:citrate lyase subunit beta/citryl-CoA lyase
LDAPTPAFIQKEHPVTVSIESSANERNQKLIVAERERVVDLEPKFLLQMAHLTTPATVAKYVEAAATKSAANLVMLDLEDSIPRGNDQLLQQGRDNIVNAFVNFDWGRRLRFFRPRGLHLDPSHSDIIDVVTRAGAMADGLVYPKVESAAEVVSIDHTLLALETKLGLPHGKIKIEVLIESANAEEQVFEITRSSKRLVGLIFGAFDYWGSLRMIGEPYRTDHKMIDHARARIVKAAASVGIPAIAEMTLNYPTKEKSEADQKAALDECKRDAEYAKAFGFRGKWTGIPAQTQIAVDTFSIPDNVIAEAIADARLFLEAEREGRGAIMIRGKMSDRATDRIHRVALAMAYALGRIDLATAKELGVL